MTPPSSGTRPLEKLVLQVRHLNLSDCKDIDEFREALKFMERNLEATLAALACYKPANRTVLRSAKNVTMKAVHLLDLCRTVSQLVDDSGKWHDQAGLIIANYEQFRISAGHFYQAAIPESSFGVLKAAL